MHRCRYFLLCLLLLQSVYTDQMAPCFPEARVDVPKNNDSVPGNIRFRIGFFPAACTLSGPEFRFMLVNSKGEEAAFEKEQWRQFLEIKPLLPLAAGAWTLKVRQPVSQSSLGPWQELVSVDVTTGNDISAPDFLGISSANVQAVRGLAPRSPCEMQEAWVIKTTILFGEAVDAQCPHDLLLYVLERRKPDSAQWGDSRIFRPAKQGNSMIFEWQTSRNEWKQTWIYRLRVRDWAGNETVGLKTIVVKNPGKPSS